ncbi:MAG TPA: hypothetical protein VL201_01155 [Patescibacteria group bacterium]|jgi:hypothetical protein|nr:hypothetical protein [Patescibacteria group bacterium]
MYSSKVNLLFLVLLFFRPCHGMEMDKGLMAIWQEKNEIALEYVANWKHEDVYREVDMEIVKFLKIDDFVAFVDTVYNKIHADDDQSDDDQSIACKNWNDFTKNIYPYVQFIQWSRANIYKDTVESEGIWTIQNAEASKYYCENNLWRVPTKGIDIAYLYYLTHEQFYELILNHRLAINREPFLLKQQNDNFLSSFTELEKAVDIYWKLHGFKDYQDFN